MSDTLTGPQRAGRALQLLSQDRHGLGGMVLRARSGPARDAVLEALPPVTRLHPALAPEALLGGLDLPRTLVEGRPVRTDGLLARPGWLLLPMAERCPPDMAAILARALDEGDIGPLILLDEGADADERPPQALLDRLALHVTLDPAERAPQPLPPVTDTRALPRIEASPGDMDALTVMAARFGIDSLRAPSQALRAARGVAALSGRTALTPESIAEAVTLTLAPRATRVPEDPPEDSADTPPPPPPDPGENQTSDDDSQSMDIPDELLLEAIQTALPADLLAHLSAGKAPRGAKGQGAGQARKGNRRGRPLPARRERPRNGARIDLVATLRAAAPWQTIRKKASPDRAVIIWPSDIHTRRYQECSDRLLIFAVDASGSAALARLAEAKGAVEHLLSEAYAKRDHVALIAFRGDKAEILLPPTRSLVQTKRRLAALPGGGGTPLASALECLGQTAEQARAHGLSPAIALLTDGRANVALDGGTDRNRAQEDAQRMARWLHSLGLPGTVLDVGRRPRPELAMLAAIMGARYVPMPRAEAASMSRLLMDTLE